MSTTAAPAQAPKPATFVVTGQVRFSYAQLFEPKAVEEGGPKKYSVSLIIPKSDTVTLGKIRAAIKAAQEIGKAKLFGGKIPATLKMPLRDGDVERPEDDAYANSFFVNANCSTKPGVVDANRNPILDASEFYSGCYGLASLNFYPFNKKSMGIACGLNNVMKQKDGEPLGGRSSAEDDFCGIGGAEDDMM